MTINKIKGVVWDLDGTLLDSFTVFERIIADVVKDSGHKMPTRETILLNYHGSLEECIQKILGIDSATEVNDVIDIFLDKQEFHYGGDLQTHLFKDAVDLAQACAVQDIDQLLVTNRGNKNRGNASPSFIIAATTLSDCIKEIRAGDEVEFRKPDKRSMGDWLERHELTPEEVLIIGDQFVDAQLAINLGCRAVIVKRNGDVPHLDNLSQKDHKSIILVDSLEEVVINKS
ncbi:MAG TPA: HAD family hydrolase [Candidatus Saccharimonadales bacterium]|nr:HAD family hydrolase [Candidatus Saccharimonadales bacterium]